MEQIALIAEGPSDYAVIENIMYGFFDDDNLRFNHLQPLLDETDRKRQKSTGGWYHVLEFCKSQKLKDAMFFNDLLIIQIDTDVSEKKHFGIKKHGLSTEELIEKVKQKLINLIGLDFYIKHQTKIYFAICVHSLECWLLPIWAKKNIEKASIENCFDKLCKVKLNCQKTYNEYQTLSNKYADKPLFSKLYKQNPSLKVFIESFPAE